ncbi:uncharacterized protein LOC119789403 [Cyprinodon tularosa]|uniref:uncharacterized protein LOC119789403 n=1 Tax=Cyprinodon tularosa TaxID=77115 RepID=UPI0018E1E02E|nr:uncharacterized protein LOC119789403 [Cyprinodon tularosa]
MNPQQEVQRGNVVQSSSRAARLSVDNNCSLIINSITAGDAGGYRCQIQDGGSSDPDVYLNLMSISPVEADPTGNNITLLCSLLRFRSMGSCPENSFLWLDETGTFLTGEGVGYQFRQTGCDSYLTVKLQSSSSRRYTCQFVDGNTVKIEAHYQLEGITQADLPKNTNIIIVLGAVIFALLLLVVLAAVFIKRRKTRVKEDHKTTTEDQDSAHGSHQCDEDQSNLTYATVKDFNPKSPQRIMVKQDEETVTYSAVRTKQKREEDIDPNSLYSQVSEPKLTK